MRRRLSGFFFLALASCASAPTQNQTQATQSPAAETSAAPVPEISPEERDFQAAQAQLDAHQYTDARVSFQRFQNTYPHSRYLMLARMGIGQCLEAQENWNEALVAYQNIYKLTLNEQPELAARALYRMSFCYEALGSDDQALAALLDSYRRGKLLPEEIAKAEIPARLAMFYEKVQNHSESEKYIAIAQKGISALQGRPELSGKVLAKAYFQMGSVSLNQISTSNFSSVVRALKAVQMYPIRAMGLQVSPWSEDSLAVLKKNYRDLWNTLVEMPGVSGVDEESIQRAKMQLQASLGGEMLDLIQQADLYQPLDAEKMNSLEKDLYKYLADLTLKVQDLIYRSEAQMVLTNEAQRLNGLKRPGRIKSDVLFPEEMKASKGKRKVKAAAEPAKELPLKDPKKVMKQQTSPVIDQDPNL